MRIDKIKINGFGKIKEKQIELKDGINIIYGENEAGKSTILKFIEAILFGASKTKNGKSISDFEKYKPWDEAEFSGKIKYTLDDGEVYEVFRDFRKKNPVIYQQNEDISKKFHVDKTKEISFFEEQVGIDEQTFCHTAMIGQQEVRIGKLDANSMIQKISNLVSSGDDTISFKKSMDKLNKQQNEKIGTDRTKDKPMNIVDSNIKRLLSEKNNLQSYQENLKNHVVEKEYISRELEELQRKKEELKDTKRTLKKNEIQQVEAKFKMRNCFIVAVILMLIAVSLLIMAKNRLFALIPMILLLVDGIVMQKTRQKVQGEDSKIDADKMERQIENIEAKMNDLKVKSHILETEKVNIDEKLEALARIEEALEEQKRVKEELLCLETSYQIAKECLEKAYDEIKHNLSPKFEQKLCEITSDMTGGKYKNVMVNDESGLCIEVENGTYQPVDRLSVGTIDEMYLSLRLSTLEEISKENLPILFDETFAYFDDERLKNMMCYLQDKNYNNQIIFLTCTNREEVVLNQLKIEYHMINLEK